MINRNDIEEKLKLYGINHKVIKKYDEKHRHYHNIDHILTMLNSAEKKNVLTDSLFLAIVFHDIIYSTNRYLYKFNEFRSAVLFKKLCKNKLSKNSIKRIYKAILSTRKHKVNNILSLRLIELDLAPLYGSHEEFAKFEDAIRKEWSHILDLDYYPKRYEILKSFGIDDTKMLYVYRKYLIE